MRRALEMEAARCTTPLPEAALAPLGQNLAYQRAAGKQQSAGFS